ncbi:substrate-binding domain-containing protein [Sorangium sp. So ce375]|uniref:substrate-binding domain-containing protein n=1 Tax=Sorangium sp. So ce375 TaxID=3133306 RepID=UPI003F5BFD30
MGQGRQGSAVPLPEQWGELPGAARWKTRENAGASGPDARQPEGERAAARPPTLGIVAPFLSGAFWGPILIGIHESAQRRGIRTLVLRGTPSEVRAPSLAREQVDGWIVVIEFGGLEELARAGVPFITLGARPAEIPCPAVLPDNHGGIRSAVLHLIEHGHRRIAFVGNLAAYDVRERRDAYESTLAEAGIPFDPALVIPCDNNMYSGGRDAAPALLAQLPSCTAAVFGTDKNALGMMSELKAAGVRIPEDFAIIGFDDVVEAQSADPPLTTVRQRFEMMGTAACDLLASMIAGEPFPPEGVRTANALVLRSSCGCSRVQNFLESEGAASQEDTRATLARQMVELLLLPRPLPPDTPPTAVWPAVTRVVDMYFSALQGAAPVPAAELERAYRQAIAVTPDLGSLLSTARLMDQLPERRGMSLDAAARRRAQDFVELARLASARARLDAETHAVHQLGVLARTNYDVSFALLGGTQQEYRSLSWLETTTMVWGCLALWDDPAERTGLVVVGAYSRDGSAVPPNGSRYGLEAFPPAEMLPRSATDGTYTVLLLPIRSVERDWGILVLIGPAVVAMTGDEGTVAIWGTLLGAALERDALLESLSTKHADLQQAFASERALSQTVRELGCPIIPLLAGVLLVPLIGMLDNGRAQQVLEKVAEGVSRHEALSVLLDLTGVPFVDAQVAHFLGLTSRAAALLGAQVYLVGVRPEIAESLIDVDLGALATFSSLAAALREIGQASGRERRRQAGAEAP